MVMTARPRTLCNPYSDWSMTSTNALPTGPPSITSQPVSVTATATGTATFTVVATTPAGSGALTYQWYSGGAGGALVTGQTASVFVRTNIIVEESGQVYAVRVANNYAAVWSNNVTLTVVSNLPAAAPVITTNPQNVTVPDIFTSATFSVDATGNPYPTFRWQEQRAGSWADTATNEDGLEGWDTKYLKISRAALVTGRTFRAIASNTSGTATSSSAALTVGGSAPAVHTVNCNTGVLNLDPGIATIEVRSTVLTKQFPSTALAVISTGVGWDYCNLPGSYDNNPATDGTVSLGNPARVSANGGNGVLTATYSGWSAYTFTTAPVLKVVIPSVVLPSGYGAGGLPATPTAYVRLYYNGSQVGVATLTATEIPQVLSITGVPTVSNATQQVRVVINGRCDMRSPATYPELVDTITITDLYLEG